MNANRKTPGATIRAVTTVTVIILAIGAAVLSYYSLSSLAAQSGIPHNLSWLFPVIIDGLMLAGSMLVLYSAIYETSSWFGWVLTLLGVGASTAGNIFVAPDDIAAQIVHAAPPVILALSLEGLMMLLRHSTKLRVEASDQEKVETVQRVTTGLPSKPVYSPIESVAPVSRIQPVVAASAPSIAATHTPPVESTTVDMDDTEAALSEIAKDTTASESAPGDLLGEAPVQIDDSFEDSPLFTSLSAPQVELEEPAISKVPQSSTPTPTSVPATNVNGGMTIREQVIALIEDNPQITVDDIANSIEGDRKYIRKIARAELDKRVMAG